jgi:hypothetical protein
MTAVAAAAGVLNSKNFVKQLLSDAESMYSYSF